MRASNSSRENFTPHPNYDSETFKAYLKKYRIRRKANRSRHIFSERVYEIVLRTKNGLPFVPNLPINLILAGILAHVNRNLYFYDERTGKTYIHGKVDICHFVIMGNHIHILVVVHDTHLFQKFLSELPKQITDAFKRLLGVPHLSLWPDNGISTIWLDDPHDVAQKIAYIYANPAAADLVEHIDEYPGLSSYQAMQNIEHWVDFEYKTEHPWIRPPMIPKLKSQVISKKEAGRLEDEMLQKAKLSRELVLKPNSWMKCFGIEDERDVEELNQAVLEHLEQKEDAARERRRKLRKSVVGAEKLKRRDFAWNYYPNKEEQRRVFCQISDPQARMSYIAEYQEYNLYLQWCYMAWKRGRFDVPWPPGAYYPAVPKTYNDLNS